jgi:hypothetical protein
MPPFSDDDVLDYVVREAIVFKMAEHRAKQEKEQERKEFRKSHSDLRGSGTAAWQQGMTANG